MAALQTGLDSAKTDYESKQTAYLNLLKELNGTVPVVGATTGTDPNSGSDSGASTPVATTVLSELDAAKKNADEKRKALSIAQAELENARKRFDEAKQLQILVLNNSPEFLGSIGSLNTDGATYDPNKPNSGIKYEIYQADLQIAEAREKLKDNEKVYFSKNYDRTNAARTEDFFGDLWNRIQSFETNKEKLSLLEGAISGSGKTLLEKVNDLLKPDNAVLVTVFGNQGAAQIKAQLQGLTDALAKKVKDEQNGNVEKEKLPYAIEKYSASLDPILAKSDELLADFEDADKNQYQQYLNGIANISSFLTSFANTYNLNGNYLEIENFDVWKTGLSEALGDWNENLTGFQTAKTEFSQALSTYKAYATAHPNTESTLEYQLEIQKLTTAFSKYQEKTADLEEYWDDLSTRSQHLRYEALDRLQRAKTLVDMSTLDLTTRKNLKTQLDGFNNIFVKKDSSGKEIPDDTSALIAATGTKFGVLGNTFSDYANRYSYYRNTIDERSAIVDGMTSVLIQALETQRASVTAGKAQLGFLLDEDGDIDDLQNAVAGVEETAKTEAAKLDARVTEILYSKIGNLGANKSDRKFEPIYLSLTNEINALYSGFTGGADDILEIRARKIALSHLQNAGQSFSAIFDDDQEYSKLKEDLKKMRDQAAETLSFYEDDHGFLDENDRVSLRMSDDENERRKVSEYYSFGSTFFFANQVLQSSSTWMNLAGSMKSFAEAVKSGAILSGLRDDYFKEQEATATGLFKELTVAAGIGSYTSADFYKDSIRTKSGADELDSAKIAEKKAELAALISGITDPQEQLAKLVKANELSSIFGLLTGSAVKQDLNVWQKEIADAKILFENLDRNIQDPILSFSAEFDSLLNFFNTPALAQMQGYSNGVLSGIDTLKNTTDSSKPIYDPVNDIDGNSPYLAAPDSEGDPVGSPSWNPTYLDTNGKLPWESGYQADNLQISPVWTPTYRDVNGLVPTDSGYNGSSLKILGYRKPLSTLDTSNLSSMKNTFDTEAAKWNTIKATALTQLGVYKTSLAAVVAFKAAHPTDFTSAEGGTYLTLIAKLKDDGLVLADTYTATTAYLKDISDKFQEMKAEQDYLIRSAKQILGLPIDKILVPEAAMAITLPPLPPGPNELPLNSPLRNQIANVKPEDYSIVSGTQRAIVQSVAAFEFSKEKEVGQFSGAADQGAYFFLYNLGRANAKLEPASQAFSKDAAAWVNSLQGKDVPLNGLAARLNSLNDRVVYYKEGAGPNQIGQSELVGIVNRLRDFLLEKSLNGIEFNPVLKEIVESAGAFTDQIENIQYLQSYASTDKKVSDANLLAVQEAQKTLTEVSKLATELNSFLVAGNGPAYTNLSQVQGILEKYETLKNKPMDQSAFETQFRNKLGDSYWLGAFQTYKDTLASSEYFFSPTTREKIEELKANSWEIYKRNLSNAYLTQRVGNPILSEFLNELRGGKFSVLIPNQGVISIDSKFLGKNLSEAQIVEIGDYLKPFDSMALVQRQGLISDLDNFLKDYDPDLKAQMKTFSLVNQYGEIRSGVAQGAVFPDRNLPPELKDFALISAFEYFLDTTRETITTGEGENKKTELVAKYDPKNADSRRKAMSDFLLKLGPVHKMGTDGKLVLDTARQTEIENLTNGYLADYGTKNPASFLNSQILKDFEARNAYYTEKELRIRKNADPSVPAEEKKNELSYDDLVALKSWIVEAKFDVSTETAVIEAARMDFLLSHYYGEDTEDLKPEELAKNPELSKFYGDGGKGYFSEMDSYFTGLGQGVLTQADKDRFNLLSSGVADVWGLWQYDPSSLISSQIVLRNFSYADEYSDLVESLNEEGKRLQKELAKSDALVKKEKYVNDYRNGLIKFTSYQSYLGVPTDNVASDVTTNEGLAIQGKLRELEMDAEQKLGGLFNLLETHKSYVFDDTQLADALPDDAIQTVADLNPGLRTTAKFMSSSYTLGDSILPKDGDGNYNFDGDFTNLKARLDQALNVVSPGSVDYDKYSQEVSKQSGMIGTLKNSIEMAGQSYVLLSEKLKSGVDPRAELAAATIAFETANSKIEDPTTGLKKQYQDAEAAVAAKQNEYLNKEKQVSDAYKIMLSAQDTFNQKAALYDYATLLNYSKHDLFQASTNAANTTEADSIPPGYIDTPKKMAKERLAAVQKEYDEKVKQVEKLEKKISSQIGTTDLKNYVQNEEKEVEKWAQLTVKYNTAETLLRQKIADLKRQIGTQQAALDGELDKLWGLAPPLDMNSAGMMDSLDGSLDFGGARYIKTENWNRDRTRITEGIIGGQLGYMDVLTAYQWEYSKGVPPEMEQYNLGNFLGRWSHELQYSSFKSLPKRANEHMNSILFPAPDTRPARFGAGSGPDSAGKYVQGYMGALNIQTMAQIYFLQQLDLICMGMCMLTIPYVNEIQTHFNYRDQLNDAVGGIRNEGIKLRNLYTELQTLTDVDDTDQLLGVLGRPEFGLTAEDLTMIGKVSPSGNGLKDLVWKSTADTATPLSFNDLVGSDGLRLAQQKAIHDSYGNYVRDNEYTAGGATASIEQTDQYGRKTALMVGSDEFLDAMGVLAEAQYQVARDAYFKKAESFVKQVGTGADKVAVKVDAKVILDEREQFMSDLLKKITKTSNGETVAYNVETTIYKTVLNDYMGPTGVVSQIFGAELQQRQRQQMQQWDLKEREFYDLKSDWVQNVSYIKQTGTKRWENMVQEFQAKWTDWRAEYKTQHEANQKVFLDRIEQTLEKKETWTKDFLQKSSEVSDELSLRQMYDSIAGIVSSMQENLPTGVSVNINVNDILSNILSKKPGSISTSLIDRASSIDTNFFLNEVKRFNFNDGGVKEQFKNLMKEMDKLSQNLIILQTLESLRSLPEAFATAVKKQNEATDKQLDSTMAYGGFARMGGTYMRSIKTASGGDEIQVLGTYLPFLYNPPNKFPEVKDSNGKLWDLGKADALINGSNVPSPSDLTVMVRLAKNKMSSDFKKVLNPEKQRNYELELGLFDPSELVDSMDNFIEGVREGETVSCMNKTPEECAKSAMSSGFLVGEVPDGDFGFAQFGQFYQILKTKKEMDKRKAQMDQARKRKSGGMGRFYNQIGAIGEGYAEVIKGTGQMILSGGKAYLKAITGDFDGAKKDLKAAGKAGERALQGYLYAVSGVVDFVMFAAETAIESVLGVFTAGTVNMRNTGLDGTFAEGNYELAKFRDSNKAQRQLNELGTRTGAEMYENDAIVDKVVSTTLAVAGIVGTILSFTPLAPIGAALVVGSTLGLAAWKSFRGAYEGGGAGALAGIASAGINFGLNKLTGGAVSVNLSYSYAGGFGAGVNVGGAGLAAGVNYNEKTGYGVSAGVASGDFSLMYTESYGRGDKRASHGWSTKVGGLNVSYDNLDGYSASLQAASAMFGTEFGAIGVESALTWSDKSGFNGSADIKMMDHEQYQKYQKGQQEKAAATKDAWNQNMFLGVLEGMGIAVANRPGRNTILDDISEAFGGAASTIWGGLKGIGNAIAGGYDAVSNFIKDRWNRAFGPKQVFMGPVMGGVPMNNSVVQRQTALGTSANPNTLNEAIENGADPNNLRQQINDALDSNPKLAANLNDGSTLNNVIIIDYKGGSGQPSNVKAIGGNGDTGLSYNPEDLLNADTISRLGGGHDIKVIYGQFTYTDELGQQIPTIKQLIYVNYGSESEPKWTLGRDTNYYAYKPGVPIVEGQRAGLHPSTNGEPNQSYQPTVALAFFKLGRDTGQYELSYFERYNVITGNQVDAFGKDGNRQTPFHSGALESNYNGALNGTWPTDTGLRDGFHMLIDNNVNEEPNGAAYRPYKDRYYHYRNGAWDVDRRIRQNQRSGEY
ncbi:hypothetical protein [Leptospira gomenensis]|nr:hypothetical protein [Leptospira gomenensis]